MISSIDRTTNFPSSNKKFHGNNNNNNNTKIRANRIHNQMQKTKSKLNLTTTTTPNSNNIDIDNGEIKTLASTQQQIDYLQELTESQEIKLLNLEVIYRTKVPTCFHKIRCRALDWLLLYLYPGDYIENDYDDNVSAIQRYRPKPIDDLVKETRFTKKEIQLLYRGFKQECPSGIVNEQSFKEVYAQFFPHGDCADYAHYVFTTIDQNCDGIVNFEDFLLGLSILARGSIDEKLKWIFNLYDINRDGKITKDELEQIITSVYDLMGKFTDPPINDTTCKIHVDYVFKKITSDEITEITLDEFLRGCYKDPAIINSISMLDTMF